MWKNSKNIKNSSDAELIQKYKLERNLDYIGELYKRHSDFVFAVCLKYFKNKDKAEDAVTEIFESLIVKLAEHEISNFMSWLYTLTKNHCLLYFRSEKQELKNQQKYNNSQNENMDSSIELYPDYEKIEVQFEKLEKYINELKKEQKLCIKLFYLEEKSYAEITEMTGFNYKEVKSYLQNGKRMLKNLFDKENE